MPACRGSDPGVLFENYFYFSSEIRTLREHFTGYASDVTSRFLEPAPGDASLNLLKMTKEGLLHGLRAALQRARKTHRPVRNTGLQLRSASGWKPVTVEIIPLGTTGRAHYLVLFEEGRAGTAPVRLFRAVWRGQPALRLCDGRRCR